MLIASLFQGSSLPLEKACLARHFSEGSASSAYLLISIQLRILGTEKSAVLYILLKAFFLWETVVFACVRLFLCLTLTLLVPVAAARCLLSSEKAKAALLSRDQREKILHRYFCTFSFTCLACLPLKWTQGRLSGIKSKLIRHNTTTEIFSCKLASFDSFCLRRRKTRCDWFYYIYCHLLGL